MLFKFSIQTQKEDFYDITRNVRQAVEQSGLDNGLCVVYCPHTTAGLTINENADPDVVRDLLYGLNEAFPDRSGFRHAEGNSAAHLKASSLGTSVTVPIERNALLLGQWQGIFFCEFDGPRKRQYYVKIM